MSIKLFFPSFLLIVLTACTNIHFDNTSVANIDNQTRQSSQWHHNFVFGLYEGSDAVDLSTHCLDGQWQSVHTYESFSNGMVELVVNQVAPIWYPKTVEVQCNTAPFKVQQ